MSQLTRTDTEALVVLQDALTRLGIAHECIVNSFAATGEGNNLENLLRDADATIQKVSMTLYGRVLNIQIKTEPQ